MTRALRTGLHALLASTLMVQAVWAVPATATGQVQAISGCAHHCRQVRSLTAASRCCGVDASASDPARLPAPAQLDSPAPALLAVLPAAPAVLEPALPTHVVEAANELATGPPLFLRLQSLLI